MKHSVFIGNFSRHIDCNSLINTLNNQQGDVRTAENPYEKAIDPSDPMLASKLEIGDIWRKAGYLESSSVEWINYYGGVHFDKGVVETFSNLVNATPYNVWISSMFPGKCVPLHWDIIKDYLTHKDDPRVVRYSFFFDTPNIGKLFVLKDEAYYMIEQGSVYKWNKWDEWHLGFNGGNKKAYMFHYIGFENQ